MRIVRVLKRQLRAAVAPAVLLGLFGYFGWSATQGAHGLRASATRHADLAAALAEQQGAEADLSAWEARVASLRGSRLDPDALDERSRAMLSLSEPDDVIVPIRR